MISNVDSDLVKITIQLVKDDSDYPPADFEHVWARTVGPGLYKLDNIPFFARGLRVGDVVSANARDDQEPLFSRVVHASDHSTLRVIVFRGSSDVRPLEERVSILRSILSKLGCSTELSHLPGLVAVDVPASAKLSSITKMLSDGEAAGLWEYEEAATQQAEPR
jgi:hypothetical protein